MSRWPALIHLTGAPAAGKRTVAVALVEEASRRGHPTVLVDNHLVARPIFSLIDNDGTGVLPPEVWPHVHAIRHEVLATIEELSPSHWSFVFTNYLLAEEPTSHAAIARMRDLAVARDATYLPVVLTCEKDELLRRVPNPDRREHQKWIDPDAVAADLERRDLLVPGDALTIDTTSRPPLDSAALILDALG